MLSPVKVWRNQQYTARLLGKTGKIVSYAHIRVPPEGFSAQAPYYIVLVELSDKTKITAQLVDWATGSPAIGQKVKTIIRRTMEVNTEGIIPYGIKVKAV